MSFTKARLIPNLAFLVLFAALPLGAAELTKLEIVPTLGGDADLRDGWQGIDLYDLAEFRVVPTWDDGEPDPGCRRAGEAPAWKCSSGWFEGEKKGLDRVTMAVPGSRLALAGERATEARGAAVLWCTGYTPKPRGAVRGTVAVRYGGKSATLDVVARDPEDLNLPIGQLGLAVTKVPMPGSDQGKMVFDHITGLNRDFTKPYRKESYYQTKRKRVRAISEALEKHIRLWLAGEAPARIPSSAFLDEPGLAQLTNLCDAWTLCRPEEVSAEEQWLVRPAMKLSPDYTELYYMAPDPHCSYLILPGVVAPLGTRLVVEGKFPRCRFMSYQVSPPYDPCFPAFCGSGTMEVPLVDVDIAPRQGSVNPFLAGADRAARKRDYKVQFLLTEGDAVALNEKQFPGAMTNVPTAYRAAGSARIGGAFVETGSWGKGAILPGMLWLRYYAPDRKAGPLGGVPLPKCYLQLSTGERFWIRHDLRLVKRRCNFPIDPARRAPADFGPFDSSFGWTKAYGGFLQFAEGYGVAMADNPVTSLLFGGKDGIKTKLRAMDREVFGRGPGMPRPGNYEVGSTYCAHIHYPSRQVAIPRGKVLVLTGKLPRVPDTRGGSRIMSGGEARYWSLTRYGASASAATSMGLCYDSIMDDEFAPHPDRDHEGWYIFVYSGKADRPANASAANGVTWRDWGPDRGLQSFVMRWMCVKPDWHDPKNAPDESNVPRIGAWSHPDYDQNLIGRNKPGVMGDFHPVLHLMTKAQFEALGPDLDPQGIPHAHDW